MREIARKTLEAFGYRALVAADGAEAVKHFADRREEVAVALVDMMMPVLDGNATVTVLQKMRPGLPVIGASGLGTSAIIASAKAAGVSQFLPKPYAAEALLKALRSVLDKPPVPVEGI